MFRICRFRELMKGLPRGTFDRQVEEHQADKYNKGFSRWDQLLAMIYAQLSGATSLRTLEAGFNAQQGQHYHMGTGRLRRSTLSDANAKRNPEVFAALARTLMASCSRELRRQGEACLYLLDSTSVTLKGRGFDEWTSAQRNSHTQGLKLHVLYAADTHTPIQQSLTAANVNDVEEGRLVPIERGACYVFDKGYCDYTWWHQIDAGGAQFVTRFKSNAAVRVERRLPVAPAQRDTILSDELVCFRHPSPGGKRHNPYTAPLRRITVARPDHPTPLVLASNDLHSPPEAIAQAYRQRWQVELFFKWIKQHLKIKRFLGCSENAVRTQILCALITYLLLALYHRAQGAKQSLWHFLNELSATLFQRPAIEIERYRRRRDRHLEIASRQHSMFV